jgi:hypothetical protein
MLVLHGCCLSSFAVQCGLNGQRMPPKPHPKVYSAWPAPDEDYDHQDVTELLLEELRAAASVVLPEAAGAAISTELQLQLDEQQDEQHQHAVGKHQNQRYAAAIEAPAPVDAAGAFEGVFGGDSMWLPGEEVTSGALQRNKRQRVAVAPGGAGMFGLGQAEAWAAGEALNLIEGSQTQLEE